MTKIDIYNKIEKIIENMDYLQLTFLLNDLKEDIKKEIVKDKGGKLTDLNIVKSLLKSIQTGDEKYKGYHEFTFNFKKYYGFTNRCYLIASTYNYEFLPAKELLNISHYVFDNNSIFDKEKIQINLNDLKLHLKLNRSKEKLLKNPYVIKTKDFDIGFNAKYLYNTLTFCQTDYIYIQSSNIKGVYVKNDEGTKMGVVMPTRLKN